MWLSLYLCTPMMQPKITFLTCMNRESMLNMTMVQWLPSISAFSKRASTWQNSKINMKMDAKAKMLDFDDILVVCPETNWTTLWCLQMLVRAISFLWFVTVFEWQFLIGSLDSPFVWQNCECPIRYDKSTHVPIIDIVLDANVPAHTCWSVHAVDGSYSTYVSSTYIFQTLRTWLWVIFYVTVLQISS